MKVKFKKPFRLFKAGETVDLADGVANLYVERMKIADYVREPNTKSAKNGQSVPRKRTRNTRRGKGSV